VRGSLLARERSTATLAAIRRDAEAAVPDLIGRLRVRRMQCGGSAGFTPTDDHRENMAARDRSPLA
jgi:hypothetical protein